VTTPHIGSYRLDRVLGTGSFATVWLAFDEHLDAPVAIKILADNWARNSEIRRRFIEEARLLRRIDDDRIVRVYSVGDLPDGRPYFVMAWADRGTLLDRMQSRPPPGQWDLATALWVALGMADCLAVVHAFGIVHRDIKPSNVLFRSLGAHQRGSGTDERILLGDFGLAKDLVSGSGFTMAAGTPAYMAPEQAQTTSALDVRADLFAAAAVLYELLTGHPAYAADTLDSARAGTRSRPERLAVARPDLPVALQAILDRGLDPDPAGRYSTAAEWSTVLKALVTDDERTAGAPVARQAPAGPPPAAPAPPAAPVSPPSPYTPGSSTPGSSTPGSSAPGSPPAPAEPTPAAAPIPAIDLPVPTGAPTTGAPTTDAPTTDAPTTGAPTTGAPTGWADAPPLSPPPAPRPAPLSPAPPAPAPAPPSWSPPSGPPPTAPPPGDRDGTGPSVRADPVRSDSVPSDSVPSDTAPAPGGGWGPPLSPLPAAPAAPIAPAPAPALPPDEPYRTSDAATGVTPIVAVRALVGQVCSVLGDGPAWDAARSRLDARLRLVVAGDDTASDGWAPLPATIAAALVAGPEVGEVILVPDPGRIAELEPDAVLYVGAKRPAAVPSRSGGGLGPLSVAAIVDGVLTPAGPAATGAEPAEQAVAWAALQRATWWDAARARRALDEIDAGLTSAGAVPGADRLRAQAELLRLAHPAIGEVSVLADEAAGRLRLPDPLRVELRRVLGGGGARERVGAPPGAPPAEIRRLGAEGASRWRALVNTGRIPFTARGAAAVVARAYDRLAIIGA
jgi:serine/threonine protein kinase